MEWAQNDGAGVGEDGEVNKWVMVWKWVRCIYCIPGNDLHLTCVLRWRCWAQLRISECKMVTCRGPAKKQGDGGIQTREKGMAWHEIEDIEGLRAIDDRQIHA